MAIEVTINDLQNAIDKGVEAERKHAHALIELLVNDALKKAVNDMSTGELRPPDVLYINVMPAVTNVSPYHYEQMQVVAKALTESGIPAKAVIDDEDRWSTDYRIDVRIKDLIKKK